jgi:hypothetical protein
MLLIATIDAPVVIQRIFAHLGLPSARTFPPSPSFGAPARAKPPALSDMTLEQVPGARANSEVGAERPGGRRPLAASKLRFDLSRAP